MIKNEKKYILYAFLLNLAMGVVFVATGFIIGKGTFYLGTDYNYQQILFGQMARDNILAGNFLWMDNFELGSSLIGALSFYGVGSPFFWLTLLFPNVSYPIIAPCMLALKLAVAGTGTYCYIRQYTKECKWALVASMLYAFSGYQIFNINFHFQDALAFFPFLLLALDINVKKDKKGWFAVTVALMAFTNYFFLAQIIVFLVIYFVVKLWTKEYSLNTKLFVQLAIESILGVSSAMVLLLPTVLFMAGNPRLSQSIFTVETLKLFFYKPYRYADLLRAVLLPAENLFNRGIILKSNTTAAEMYLPVVGMIPAFGYMCKKKKDWMTKLSIVCFVFMLNPVLNSSFTLFNSEYYPRWFFMPILIFSTMSAIFFEEDMPLKDGMKIWTILVALFLAVRYMWHFYFKAEFFPNRLQAFAIIAMGLAGVFVTVFVKIIKSKNLVIPVLVIAIFVQTAACFGLYTYYTHKFWNEGFGSINEVFHQISNIEYPDNNEYYRTETEFMHINAGLVSDKPSINVFATNVTGSVFEFYLANDMERAVNSFMNENFYGFFSLLGTKYTLVPEGGTAPDKSETFTSEPVYTSSGYDFYENIYYSGMGFAYDNAISDDEYALIPETHKHLVSMDAIVLDNEDLENYGHYYTIKKAVDYTSFDKNDFISAVNDRRLLKADEFTYKNNSYTFTTNLTEDTVYYISVPFDKGFSATVNGKNAEIIKVNNGFIGIVMNAGENNVQLNYFPQGLTSGMAISIVSILLLVVYQLSFKRKKNL